MKKRIAYIGLSYPSLFDYRHQAKNTRNDIFDSPNPIIDSPLGLMILYDELWFLCESICPNNMRTLPYVKFVDVLFPNLWFEGALDFLQYDATKDLCINKLSYNEILKRMNIKFSSGLDTHSHSLQIGNIKLTSNGSIDNYYFDLYILSALQNLTYEDVEMVSNSNLCSCGIESVSSIPELTEKLIITDIPNYLSIDGPYHECIEVLRNNNYLSDFRKWIVSKHSNIQHNEINDVCNDVIQNIKETQKNVFKKHLEDNSYFSLFKSTGKTIISTIGGFVHPSVSVISAMHAIKENAEKFKEVKSGRWQGFIIDACDTTKRMD